LDLIVENEDESATGSSEDVGKASLEESSTTFISVDLLEAIHGSGVHSVGAGFTSGHHESSSDGIEWIRDDTSGDGDNLCESPLDEEMRFSVVVEENNFTGIEHTEVRGSVSDNTNNGDTETVVELRNSGLSSLGEAVNKSSEFSLGSLSNIGSKSGSCEIEWVDEAEGGSTGSTTGGHVTREELDWLSLWAVWAEVLLVGILAGEVEGLGWEITDDVGQVTSPESAHTLLGDDS